MGPPTTADSKPPPPAIAADGTAGTTTASAMASGDPSTPGAQQQQQQEPVFQPQSLQDIAVRCLSRHLEVFGRARYRGMTIPVDLLLRVLRAASSHERLHSAELMLRVVRNLPCLECAEVDEEYWRPIVERTIGASTCPIAEPYPALVARLRRSKKALEAWVAARKAHPQPQPPQPQQSDETQKKKKKDKGKAPEQQQQQKQQKLRQPSPQPPAGIPDADLQAAMRLLKELDRAPASTQLLADTGLGAVVGQLSKLEASLAPAAVIGAAKALRKKWKALVRQQEEEEEAAAAAKTGVRAQAQTPIPESGEAAAATSEEEDGENVMSPLSIGRRAVRTTSWLGVYKFSLAYQAHRRAVVGKRALALAQGEEAGRRRTKGVAAWTDADEERERRRVEKRPAPGNTERVKKIVKYCPRVLGPKEKPFGGLVMVKGTKKKLKVVG